MKNIRLYEYLLNQALLEEELRYRDAIRNKSSMPELDSMKEKIITMRSNLLASRVRTESRVS
jgi:hypothetical protein